MIPKINCDMGEGFGKYRVADDAAIMPLIDQANIACGFHASDPVIMSETVALAVAHSVEIGAHPSLPDLQGFGRREMKISPSDLFSMLCYQVGALEGVAKIHGAQLSHLKPHGALYGMACRDPEIAGAIGDVAKLFDLRIFGLGGTHQETVYRAKNLEFVGEFYADLQYQDNGHLAIVANPKSIDPIEAAQRAISAVAIGATLSNSGKTVPVAAQTICVHSDNANAMGLLEALNSAKNDTNGDAA